MPIRYAVDPGRPLVRSTYSGRITPSELSAHALELEARGLLGVPHLIDGRQASVALSAEDTHALGRLMADLRRHRVPGPVAFVPGDDLSYRTADAYQDAGAGQNPRFAIFAEIESAEAWLGLVADRPGRGPAPDMAGPFRAAQS
jgi:cell wall-associated NlpC family hydrolase